jgi:acetyl esterase/lipase
VPWVFLVLSALSAASTLNALWPVRRPWWLKLPSFNQGWFANELPFHALVGNVVAVAVFAGWGALDDAPGMTGTALMVASSAGLVVLGAAHWRAGPAMDRALGDGFGAAAAPREAVSRARLVFPWLAWVRTPGVEHISSVVYASAGERDLALDVYRPAKRTSGCPVLVEVHGGGWVMGDRRFDARPLMTSMARRGWVCFSVDYRLGRHATWPDHIVDVKTALSWVREHAADYGGDAGYVAITGGSAGGHLAALAALTPNDAEYKPPSGTEATIRACVSFYGVYDFNNALGLRAPAEARHVERNVVRVAPAEAPQVYERAAPTTRVNAAAPPFLVVQGTSDNLVLPAESRAFVDRLRGASRQPVVYAEIPRGHHAFDAVPSVRTAHVVAGVERFLEQCYATRPVSSNLGNAGTVKD